MHKTNILDVVARKLAPFILLFGCYLITYGHLSPGGGFQGGVVLASGIILLLLARGFHAVHQLFPTTAMTAVEVAGLLGFLAVGVAGFLMNGHVLSNFFPVETVAETPHAGFVFMLNLIIGLKVGAGMTLLCYYLLNDV
jgi:multicomponent Na+:H+ antiporter subunit B